VSGVRDVVFRQECNSQEFFRLRATTTIPVVTLSVTNKTPFGADKAFRIAVTSPACSIKVRLWPCFWIVIDIAHLPR
jgi:hypothetical protein